MTASVARMRYRYVFSLFLSACLLAGAAGPGRLAAEASSPAIYQPIVGNLNQGHANDAIAQLQAELARDPRDAEAHNLLGRVYFQEERWKDSVAECERAVQLQPGNSNYHLWLGRAEGELAEHSNLIAAYSLAKKVHQEFEKSVRLSPTNVAALADLGEYLVEAPGFLGGSMDRAQQIAERLTPLDAARAHDLRAQMATKRKDFSTAEHELQLAVQTSSHPAESWMDLASFYARQKNYSAMQQAIRQGLQANPTDGQALVHAASILIRNRQDARQAAAMLRLYLASAQRSEDAPAFQVHVQLGKLLAMQGDATGAKQQFARANQLASDYVPARRLPLQS